ARPKTLPQIEVEAVRRRLDLQIARLELAALAKSYGLTQAMRFVNLLELSGVARDTRERPSGARINDRGFELELQIPLVDCGHARFLARGDRPFRRARRRRRRRRTQRNFFTRCPRERQLRPLTQGARR